MSYILDALKKAQKRRTRGAVPDVLTVQEIVVRQSSGRRLLPMVIVCGAVLTVLIVIWYAGWRVQGGMGPEVSVGKSAPSGAVREIPREGTPADGQGLPSGPSHGGRNSISVATQDAKAPSGGIIPRVSEKTAETRKAVPDAAEKAEEVRGSGDTPAKPPDPQARQIPPAEHRIYSLRELPDVVRKALPEFTITALMYSREPSSRMARINGRLRREGEDLPQGVRLDEITQEGVILTYQGYRFAVALK